ncbi:hypothetical protein [Streptomyces sp. SID3343]|uniref:hypothetical protein n=1 Tax=Streptomyces sp. SID3343 TaxID=2690260 RepID=UPI00136BC7D9|nr:hypothetical protein [Streptomyces sp. SID3343]MYW01204.1 hypothetical protein [Streptomyces sp. SID3343]
MAVSVMPAADTLARTLLAARGAEWGDWSAGAVRETAGRLGWQVRLDEDGAMSIDPGVPGLACRAEPAEQAAGAPSVRFTAPLPIRADPTPTGGPGAATAQQFGYVAGQAGAWGTVPYVRDRGRELDAAHTRLGAALTATLGPAPWRGGPNAWLRWRSRGITLRLLRDDAHEALVMELFPTRVGEAFERRAFETAGSLAELPYIWCVSRPDMSLAELFLPFGPEPRDWVDFHAALPRVLSSLVVDMPLVGWVEPVLLVLGDVLEPAHTAEVRVGQDRLELGNVPGNGRQVWLRPGAEHAATAAESILEAFAFWGIDRARRLRTRAWTSGGYVDLPGIGVRPEGTHPDDA